MFDKFNDECAIFGIANHSEAANLAYLGLYAMQHRGQESAGIAVSNGRPTSSSSLYWSICVSWPIGTRTGCMKTGTCLSWAYSQKG